MLPSVVLERVRAELRDWSGSGFSVLEASQWDPRLVAMFEHTTSRVRHLLDVPESHRVLFMHGGASHQFAIVPMNLGGADATAGYVHTGLWSGKAIRDAANLIDVHVVATTADDGFTGVPRPDELHVAPRSAYLHYTPSETAQGTRFPYVPDVGDVPLVADASSSLFSEQLDLRRLGLVYASAQKALGATGLTIVIVREDLIGRARPGTPDIFDYALHERTRSRHSTPPVFALYIAGLMLDWIDARGGVPAVAAASRRRSDVVYDAIDSSALYVNPVEPSARSRVSIPFHLADPRLDEPFLTEAAEAGLHALAGHSSVGGMRASLYPGMPEGGAEALAAFMGDFADRHG